MKILFLDIDGVVNSIRSATASKGYPYPNKEYEKFDEIALHLIRLVCHITNTKIVLSSTWRFYINTIELGEQLGLPIIDETPKSFKTRGYEIKQWLDNNDCEKYAIVDDYSDMLEEQQNFFVKTDPLNGLSYENYTQLLEILT